MNQFQQRSFSNAPLVLLSAIGLAATLHSFKAYWLIDAMIEIENLEQLLPGLKFGDEESKDYQTLAGFIVKHLNCVPKEGETFESQGYFFEVLDMDRHRVDKVLVMPAKPGGK